VLLGKVQTGFQVGQKVEKVGAKLCKRSGQAACQLHKGDIQGAAVLRIDHAQHGFGLSKIDPAGQECAQSKLARFGKSYTVSTHNV
jgi:hypothetical protein